MFVIRNCWGNPIPSGVCARKPWSFSSICKNFSWQHPPWAEIWSSEKVDLGGLESACSTVLLVDQCSPVFSPNVGGIALYHLSYRFWISLSIPEIFAIKLWSRSKLTQIFHVFGPKLFWTEGPQNFGTWIIKYKNLPIIWQSFAAIGRLSSERGERACGETKKEKKQQ